jgi:hypothetical protein
MMMDDVAFSGLAALLATFDPSVESALSWPQVRMVFRRQYPPLIQFLGSPLHDLTMIAIGKSSCTSRDIMAAAFYCLTNIAPAFTNPLTTNRNFLQDLLSALPGTSPATDYNILSFHRIFDLIIQTSTGFVFLNITG